MTVDAVPSPLPIADSGSLTGTGLTVAVLDSLAAAEPFWRTLEASAVMTPYQRFDWIKAYRGAGFETGDLAVLALSDNGRPVALLPLEITSRIGLRIGRLIGMPISNSDALIFDPAYAGRLDAETLRTAFAALRGSGHALDVVSFHCLQGEDFGQANPLLTAFGHAPAPNHLYFSTTNPGETPYIEQALPHKRRTNIRRSIRRLGESFGPLRLEHARTPDDVEMMLAVFHDQRAQRFREMGVDNVFARPALRAFMRDAALGALGKDAPALRLHALYAGDQIVAMSLGAYTRTHYSQFINSTASGPAAKYTLMGILLSLLLDELRGQGVTSFDMGLGDFDYKTDWSRPYIVYDSVVPISPVGIVAAPLLRAGRRIRRVIKQTPALWRVARSILALKARLRARGGVQ